MSSEWLWIAAIAGGIGAFMLVVDLLASHAAPRATQTAGEEEDEDEGSSFSVGED